MRILHVTDFYRPRVGGIELFVEGLALRQAAAGHEVTVLSGTSAGSSADPASLTVVRVPLGGYVPLVTVPIDLASYDVVHTHLSVASILATRVGKAAARAGVPVVNTVHSMWNGREGWVRIIGAIARWHRLPQVWTSVSDNAAATVRKVLPAGTDVHVVSNAIDVAWWSSPVRRASSDTVTFATVMRLSGRKRPLQLIDLLAHARAEVPASVRMRAVIVGEGKLEERIRARIAALGLDWVTLTGQLTPEQVRGVFRAADVFVAPSHQESFGLAALEARAAGLPVVAMSSGGVGEFVADGVEGMLCESDDALAEAMALLASDATLRGAMAANTHVHPPLQEWRHALAGFESTYALAGSLVTAHREDATR